MVPFQREFDLLEALCAKDIKLRLDLGDGIEASVLNHYQTEGKSWLLPDQCYYSEVWAVIRLKIPAKKNTGAGKATYSIASLRSRRFSLSEQGEYDQSAEKSLPSYLRRKQQQGKMD